MIKGRIILMLVLLMMKLQRLWAACAVLSLLIFFAYLHSCAPEAGRQPAASMPPAPAPKPQPPATPARHPSYTFLEPASPPAAQPAATAAPDTTVILQAGQAAAPSRHTASQPGPRRKSAAAPRDSTAVSRRLAPATPQHGFVPDLDIRLAGVDLQRVMQHYGYVPAVKTRNRLLGKIAGARFVPLTAAEISQYARRGRSGADYPEAERWRRRIAAELRLSAGELQFIFLVPHSTERVFIAAEMAALQRAGKSPREVSLIRAHFAADLAVVVDTLFTKTGEIVPVDSLRLP